MATVQVTLPRYNQSWYLSHESILSVMPESLIGQALQEEPDVPKITLENSDVTPEAMHVAAEILQGREPKHYSSNLSSSARYLNLPWLIYYEDPLYDQVERPGFPGGTYDTIKNRDLLKEAIRTGHNVTMGYLLLKGVSPIKKNILVYQNPQGISPERPTSPALEEAMAADNVEAFQILMLDPRVAEQYSLLGLFQSRYLGVNSAISRYLLQVLHDNIIDDEWIRMNAHRLVVNLEFIQLIYPLLTTQDQKDALINTAIVNNHYDVFSWLIDQPGNTNYREYLETAVEWSRIRDVFYALLFHLPNLTREDYAQLLEQAEYSSYKVAKDVLTEWMQEHDS